MMLSKIPDMPSAPRSTILHPVPKEQMKEYEELENSRQRAQRLRKDYERIENGFDLVRPTDCCTNERDGYDRYRIICPYCLNSFEIGDLQYRARTKERPTGELYECFEPEYDEKYAQHWKNMGVEDVEPLRNHILDADPDHGEIAAVTFGPDEAGRRETQPYHAETRARMRRDKVSEVEDKYGNATSDRICPECHESLPAEIGFCPNYIYSFMGNSSCGKTVYLNRLILTLTAINFLGGKYHGTVVNDEKERGKTALARAEKLFRGGTGQSLAEATEVGYIRPTILLLQNMQTRERFFITLFDYPGEAIWKDDDNFFQPLAERVRRNSDGLIMMFDAGVTLNEDLPEEYKTDAQKGKDDRPEKAPASQVIDHIYKSTFNYNEVGKPVALVISKSDLIRLYLEKKGERIPPYLQPVDPHSKLDMSDLYQCHIGIESFLDKHDWRTTATASVMCHGNHAWFAVSSTTIPLKNGTIQEGEQVSGLREGDPLEWLLYRNGHLEADFHDDKEAMRWAAQFQVSRYHELKKAEAAYEQACEDFWRLREAYHEEYKV